MRLATILLDKKEQASLITKKGFVPVEQINKKFGKDWAMELLEIIQKNQLKEMIDWYSTIGKHELERMEVIPKGKAVLAPLYRRPRKIWGIGLNYVAWI